VNSDLALPIPAPRDTQTSAPQCLLHFTGRSPHRRSWSRSRQRARHVARPVFHSCTRPCRARWRPGRSVGADYNHDSVDSPSAPGSTRRSARTPYATASSQPPSTPASHSATSKKPPHTPTPEPPRATTADADPSTGTPPTSWPPSSPAPAADTRPTKHISTRPDAPPQCVIGLPSERPPSSTPSPAASGARVYGQVDPRGGREYRTTPLTRGPEIRIESEPR